MKEIFDAFLEIASERNKKYIESYIESATTHTNEERLYLIERFHDIKRDWKKECFILKDNGFQIYFSQYKPIIKFVMSHNDFSNEDTFTTLFTHYLDDKEAPYSIRFDLNSSIEEGNLEAEFRYNTNPDKDFYSEMNFDNDEDNFNYYYIDFQSYKPEKDPQNMYVFADKEIILLFLNNYLKMNEKQQDIADILLLNYDIQLEKDVLLNSILKNSTDLNELIKIKRNNGLKLKI